MPSAALGRAARGSTGPASASTVGGADPLPGSPLSSAAGGRPSAATSPLGATLDRITTAALAAAARLSPTTGATSDGSTAPSTATDHEPTAGERDAADSTAPRSVTGPAAPWASAPPSPALATGDLGGALGELVGRWQQSEALPEPAPMSAPRSPFAPLATALTTGFADGGRSPDGSADEVSLDQLQAALDELLRREAEQHGLEGGLV
jgi:hypothetical protein